jgi:hypothetical protein
MTSSKVTAIPQSALESGNLCRGGVSERPKENASKAFVGVIPPRVQIPPPPPFDVLWHPTRSEPPDAGFGPCFVESPGSEDGVEDGATGDATGLDPFRQ